MSHQAYCQLCAIAGPRWSRPEDSAPVLQWAREHARECKWPGDKNRLIGEVTTLLLQNEVAYWKEAASKAKPPVFGARVDYFSSLARWLSEAGIFRSVEVSMAAGLYECKITECDPQPEFYGQRLIAVGKGKELGSAIIEAYSVLLDMRRLK